MCDGYDPIVGGLGSEPVYGIGAVARMLDVSAASTMGNDAPPSAESRISTPAQLTGAAVVFATFQVTGSTVPWIQVTAVLGAVTRNGPAVETSCCRFTSWRNALRSTRSD